MRWFAQLLIFLGYSFVSYGMVHAADLHDNSTLCLAQTYKDKAYLNQTTEFHVYEDIRLKFECSIPRKGDYSINIEWIDPDGKLARNSSHSFIVDSTQDYVIFFTLKLHRKGIFSQVFSGEEYTEDLYGNWKVISYLNNQRIGENRFRIIK